MADNDNDNINYPVVIQENSDALEEVQRTYVGDESFGSYLKNSRLCPICLRHDHMEINRMRGQEYKTILEISNEKGIPMKGLRLHFDNHFQISKNSQDIINVKEDTSEESKDIITKVLEGDIDLYGGALSVLESKAQRLDPIKARIKKFTDDQENNNMEDIDTQEFILLNKLAEDIENSIMKVYQVIDKKVFPTNKEEIAKAVLSYKLSVLSKFVDSIVVVFLEFEQAPEYKGLVQQLRTALAQKVSSLETTILRSGGVMKVIEEDTN